jgi:transcriptional regulator with XRE-family HTH domain
MTFGKQLAVLLEKRNTSRTDLAEKLGVKNRSSVDNWCNDENYPTVENLIAICDLLNVSADELLCLKPSRLEYLRGYAEGILALQSNLPEVPPGTFKDEFFWRATLIYQAPVLKHLTIQWEDFETLLERLSSNSFYREDFVELTLLLIHFMNTRLKYRVARIKYTKKASEVAKQLAEEHEKLADTPKIKNKEELRAKSYDFRRKAAMLQVDGYGFMLLESGDFARAESEFDEGKEYICELPDEERGDIDILADIFRAYSGTAQGQTEEVSRILRKIREQIEEKNRKKQGISPFVKIRYFIASGDHQRNLENYAEAIKLYEEAANIKFDSLAAIYYRLTICNVDLAIASERGEDKENAVKQTEENWDKLKQHSKFVEEDMRLWGYEKYTEAYLRYKLYHETKKALGIAKSSLDMLNNEITKVNEELSRDPQIEYRIIKEHHVLYRPLKALIDEIQGGG